MRGKYLACPSATSRNRGPDWGRSRSGRRGELPCHRNVSGLWRGTAGPAKRLAFNQ